MSIIWIILTVFILAIASIGIGSIVIKKSNVLYTFAIGYFSIYGINQLVSSLLIKFEISVNVYTAVVGLILLLGLILFVKNFKQIKLNKKIIFLLLLAYLLLMIYIFTNSAIGIENFDSTYYLSIVNEYQINDTIGKINYSIGTPEDVLNKYYDFQTYYSFWGILLKYNRVLNILLFNSALLNIEVYIWSASILYYISAFSLYAAIIDYFKIDDFKKRLFIFIFPLFLFSTQFYVEALAFYGNTYRTLITGYICFEVYKMFKDGINKNNTIILMLLFSALIGVSATGFFVAVILFLMLLVINIKNNIKNLGYYSLVLSLPILQFSWYFLGNIALPLIAILVSLVLLYEFKLCKYKQISKYLMWLMYVLYALVVLISIYLHLSSIEYISFFRNHSYVDMVYDYMNFTELKFIILNSIIWILTITYLIKSKGLYKLFLVIFLLLYNPLTYVFLSQFLTGVVFYRSLDILFNQFNLILFIVFIFHLKLENKKYLNIIVCLTFVFTLAFSINNYREYYHHFFMPKDDYSYLYKIGNEELDVAKALYNDINYNANYDARVISQFLEVKSYVPTIDSLLSSEELRRIDRYSENQTATELIRVFYPRINANFNNFNEDTDYTKACELILENKTDYVIIDNEENYLRGPHDYVYMNEEVENCGNANIIYTNNKYTLYKFID